MKSKKSDIKNIAKKMKFKISGDFIVLFHNEYIISGLALDGTPSTTYIWTFVVPTYADSPFLHMSLGERILACEIVDECLENSLEIYEEKVEYIKTPNDIIHYLDINNFSGEYERWIRILSMIRVKKYIEVEELIDRRDCAFESRSIADKFKKLLSSLEKDGWVGVQHLLDDWSTNTDRLLAKTSSGRNAECR